MQTLAKICFWLYVVILIVTGLGAVGAAHETLWQLGIHKRDWAFATLLSQIRAVSAMQFGFGLFAIFLRKEIFSQKRVNAAFLSVLLITPLARALSLILDGVPHPSMIGLMVFELGVLALFFVHARRFVWKKGGAAKDADLELSEDPKAKGSKKRVASDKAEPAGELSAADEALLAEFLEESESSAKK